MRTHVELTSTAFPTYPGEEDDINPGRYGKRLAEFVRESLDRAGLPVREPFTEDWGWVVAVENPGFPLWVGCGNIEGEEGSFLCFIHPSKPVVRRWLKRIDTVDRVEAVADALTEGFSSRPDVAFTWVSTYP